MTVTYAKDCLPVYTVGAALSSLRIICRISDLTLQFRAIPYPVIIATYSHHLLLSDPTEMPIATKNIVTRFTAIPAAYYLILLWVLVFLKTRENISPYSGSMPVLLLSSLVFLVVLVGALAATPVTATGQPRFAWVFTLLAGAMVVYICHFLARVLTSFGYHLQPYDLAVVSGIYLALAVCAWWLLGRTVTPVRQMLFLFLCWAATSLVWWWIPIQQFPLDGDRSDMLPTIVSGVKAFLAGEYPYQWFTAGTHQTTLPYPPLMWLHYIPFVWLDLDPRWIMPPAQLFLLIVNWFAFRSLRTTAWWYYLVWLALNPFLFIRHDLHTWMLWPYVAFALLLGSQRRWLLSAVMWGSLLAFRKTLWFPYPFYAASLLWLADRQTAWRALAIATGLGALIIGPFFFASPNQFIESVLRFQGSVTLFYTDLPWNRVAGYSAGFTIAPLLWRLNLASAIPYLQVVSLSGIFFAFLWRRPTWAGVLQTMVAAFATFLYLNPQSEAYHYAPLLVITAYAALARQPDRTAYDGTAEPV